MGRFLAERYLPASARESLARDAARLDNGAEPGVRLLLTLYCPDDDTCFHLFDAGSAALIQRTASAAGIELNRIGRATQISANGASR